MKIKAGVNLHNRFDIVKNGEWVGYAENIILDQMYNRICNFSSYFNNIHFGTGSGTPTPDRTSLFSHLGTKTAVVEETIKALPTSKVIKKIVLTPEEYVGQTITEVGVAYGSEASSLVTHAMIKDAEGNPLSIEKTDIDVIEIYATIFITFNNPSDTFYFTRARSNVLIDYFVNHTSVETNIFVDKSNFADNIVQNDVINGVARKNPTVSVSVENRTRTYSTRFGISEANSKRIEAVGLTNICRAVLKPSSLIGNTRLTNIILGVGDGAQTEYELPHVRPKDIVVKVDGVVVSNYVVEYTGIEDDPTDKSLQEYFDVNEIIPPSIYFQDGFNGFSRTLYYRGFCGPFKTKSSLKGLYLVQEVSGISVGLRASSDGVSFTEILPTTSSTDPREITHDGPYYDVRLFSASGSGSPYNIKIADLENTRMPLITFATPPPQDALITADYTVEYLPKDENYVLDVEFELRFGEGV